MESSDIKTDFIGFGPIPQSKPTHIGGFGREGSFAPTRPNKIRLRSDRNIYSPVGVSSGGGSSLLPFGITLEYVDDEYEMSILAGSVNGIIPSNMFNTFNLGASVAGTTYIGIDVTSSSGTIQSASISVGSSPFTGQAPTANFPPASFVIPMGVIVDGVTYNLLGRNWVNATSSVVYTSINPSSGTLTNHYVWITS
jgi:hypothetical protein